MRLLLDTHIFLWLISGDSRLSDNFADAITDPANDVFLSAASVWEIIIKSDLGKLPLPDAPGRYIPKQRKLHQIGSLPISETSLGNLSGLPRLHRDPFDRLLISQTLAEDITFVTVDPAILQYAIPVLS